MSGPRIDNELLRWVADLHAGQLSDDAFDALQQRLRDDAEARALFLELTRHEAALRAVHSPPLTAIASPTAQAAGADRRRGFGSASLALAAAIGIAAAALVVYSLVSDGPDDSDAPPSTAPIATLIDVAEGTILVNDDIANPGDTYSAGDYLIDAGTAEFQLASGTNVQMHGRTHLRVRSSMRARLLRGRAIFRCPPQAVGYTVELPNGARVVDLGTAFDVTVAPEGRTRVAVTEGVVKIETEGGTSTWPAGATALIRDGRALVVDSVVFNAASNRVAEGDDAPGLAEHFEHSELVNASQTITAAFGAAGGPEPGSLMMRDGGVADNGNAIVGDGGETVDTIAWRLKHPVRVAGYRIRLATDGGETDAPRSAQLLRMTVNDRVVDLHDVDGAHGQVIRVFAGGPVFADRFSLALTRSTAGKGNAGPRIVEIDAIVPVQPGAVIGATPVQPADPPIGSVDPEIPGDTP